ncbi:hypothetical protein [Halorientalis pallida]|uniref:Uncharacterized protein n=1 Tax=Halorientalis pallida TaxID=2479928 RepID=A0A498KQP7_9EURY|nr:hypothetical protein [Halorientalis pallida]RXK46285.1 hypothetical protein EAF64_19600 [Halorientalis pallida]
MFSADCPRTTDESDSALDSLPVEIREIYFENQPLDLIISTTLIRDELADEIADGLVIEYENATVYGDFEQEQVLHQGTVRILPNS